MSSALTRFTMISSILAATAIPALAATEERGDPSEFMVWGFLGRAIRTARHTYARSLQGPWLLYNDQADPYQMTNLVGKAEYAALQKELDERLTAELNRIGDDFKPRQFYLGKFGYKLDHGAIPYGAGLTPTGIQSPRPQP